MDRRTLDDAKRTARSAGLDSKRRFGGGVGRILGIVFVLAVLVALVTLAGRDAAAADYLASYSVELVPVSDARISECETGWLDALTGEPVSDHDLREREVGSIVMCAVPESDDAD